MAENGSRKRGSRRAYLRDFKPDENGNYTYSGRIYRNTSGPDVLQRRLMTAIGVFSVAFVLEIAAGFLPGTGMEGHILMLLPYGGNREDPLDLLANTAAGRADGQRSAEGRWTGERCAEYRQS